MVLAILEISNTYFEHEFVIFNSIDRNKYSDFQLNRRGNGQYKNDVEDIKRSNKKS